MDWEYSRQVQVHSPVSLARVIVALPKARFLHQVLVE